MNITRIVGLLLMACLPIGLQAMESAFYQERQLIVGNISVDTYLSMVEKSAGGHARMIRALHSADYRQSPDGSYYERLIDDIDNVIDFTRQAGVTEQVLRNLKFKIRRFIEFYYDKLKAAKRSGIVRAGRST